VKPLLTRFDEIADSFQSVEPGDRLEVLLDFADRLPPLPEHLVRLRDEGLHLVHECQAPVFLYVNVTDDVVSVYGDVPREAPTARSFLSILIDAFDGQSVGVVEEAPADPLRALGLDSLLGMQRTRGLSAIYQQLRARVGAPAVDTQ
jgi:cysteine desulfuration protein SufE